MAAHRYWRIRITASANNSDSAIGELELRTSASGADQTGSGTASANSDAGGSWVASNAFDNNNGTGWNSASFAGVPVWLAYDFGSGNDKDIVEIALRVRSDYVGNAPKDFWVEYSDNGTQWLSSWRVVNATGWSTGEQRVYSYSGPSGAHRYWRLGITAVNGTGVIRVSDLEYRTSAGGADVTGSGTASASSSNIGRAPADAFDSDPATYWEANTGNHWLKYDFGASNDKNVAEVAIVGGQASVTGSPKDFTIEYSDDDTTYNGWLSVQGFTSWYEGQRNVFQTTGPVADSSIASAVRYWRLLVKTIGNSGSTAALTEMEMRSSAGGADQTGSGTANNGTGAAALSNFSNAFDNNTGTQWQHSLSGLSPDAWGYYDFGGGVTKTITEIALRSSSSDANSAPVAFKIQRSDDSLRWATPDINLSGITGWSTSQTRYFDSTGEVSGTAPAGSRSSDFFAFI
jgi:hypothetical protein